MPYNVPLSWSDAVKLDFLKHQGLLEMLQLNPQIDFYMHGALSTFWIWSIIWIKYAFICTKKVAGGSQWSLPSFLTAVDKFLYTFFRMCYAVPSSASSLIYSRVPGRDWWGPTPHRSGLCAAKTGPLPTNPWLLCVWSHQILFQEYVSPCRSQTPTITLWNKPIKILSSLPAFDIHPLDWQLVPKSPWSKHSKNLSNLHLPVLLTFHCLSFSLVKFCLKLIMNCLMVYFYVP